MRTIILLLVLTNITLFVLTRIDALGSGEGVRLTQQVQPEKITVLTPQQVAALGPGKVAALADVCVEWGPFSDAERTRALAELSPLQLGALLTQRRVELDGAYGVNVGPFATRAAADKRLAELKAQGATDLVVVDSGRGQFNVSLGVYRTEQAAAARAEALSRQGIRLARVEPRQQPIVQTLLVVRDPQQAIVTRLKDLQGQYEGSELKVGNCPTA
jgi:sporulation related protein